MLVKNLMDRLQPGMLYQRSDVRAVYGKNPEAYAVTGVVLEHVRTDNDGEDTLLVKVVEFTIKSTYSTDFVNGGVHRLLQPDDDLTMLQMSFTDIVEATRECRQLVDQQAAAARQTAEAASRVINAIGYFENAIRSYERDAIEIGDQATRDAIANIEGAGIGFDIIQMPPAVQEFMNEKGGQS